METQGNVDEQQLRGIAALQIVSYDLQSDLGHTFIHTTLGQTKPNNAHLRLPLPHFIFEHLVGWHRLPIA